jgi:hypothetical protein
MSRMGDYVIDLMEQGLYDPDEYSYLPYDEEAEYNELDEEDYDDE